MIRRLVCTCVAFVLAAIVTPPEASARNVEGVVKVVGSVVNARVILMPSGGGKPTTLCTDATGQCIRKLAGMTLKVAVTPQAEGKCLKAQEFSVLKTTSGRAAIVGVLRQQQGATFVEEGSGKKHPIARMTPGLREIIGKKAIFDLKANATGSSAVGHRVVSYALHPC